MNHTLPALDERSRQAGRLPALRDETQECNLDEKRAFYWQQPSLITHSFHNRALPSHPLLPVFPTGKSARRGRRTLSRSAGEPPSQ